MAMAFVNPSGLSAVATSARAAFSWAGVMAPSFRPFLSVAPTCIAMPEGRFDQTVRVFSLKSRFAFRRWASSSVARNASAAATARAVVPAEGLCAAEPPTRRLRRSHRLRQGSRARLWMMDVALLNSSCEQGAPMLSDWSVFIRFSFFVLPYYPLSHPMPERGLDRYLVKSLVHAASILQAFQSPGEVLRLRDVVERTGFGKGMCFRLLHTLHHCGFVEKIDERHYRLMAVIKPRKRFRIGYASQGQDSSFPREVHAGLLRAAERERLELDRCRQPVSAESRASQRAAPDQGKGRSRHRVPDRRSGGAGHRLEIPRGGHSADCDRHSAPGRHLLRRQQLSGRADRRPLSGQVRADVLERSRSTRS